MKFHKDNAEAVVVVVIIIAMCMLVLYEFLQALELADKMAELTKFD